MSSEFREDLTLPVFAYLSGYAEFSSIYVLANDLLPEFVADDPEAAALAARIIAAEVDSVAGARRRWFVEKAMEQFIADSELPSAVGGSSVSRPIIQELAAAV